MARILWTDPALEALQEIVRSISADSPRYAQRVSGFILEAVERLVDYPELGRMLPELQNQSVREVLSGRYRIVYWLHDDTCEIVAIIHGSRDLLKHVPSGPWDI